MKLRAGGECPNLERLRVSSDMGQLAIDNGMEPEVSRRDANTVPTPTAISTPRYRGDSE